MPGVKRLIRPLAAGAGVTGAIAAINRGLRHARPPVNALGGTERRWNWRGYDIFTTEAGSGPLVLLIHGIYAGASSYEYRKLFPLLAKTRRVVAIDLLGCGLSDRPNLGYSADLFTEQIVDALAEFGGTEPAMLIGCSLGAAFAARAAARANDRVNQLVLTCPTGLGSLDRESTAPQRAITAMIRSPLVGEGFFNMLASRPGLKFFLEKQAYGDPKSVTPEVLDHYASVTHQTGARYVPAHFVGGELNCNLARDLPFVEAPIMVAWGERSSSTAPLANAGEFLKLARNARLVTFAHSGLLPHEEEPERFAEAVDETFATAAS